MNQKRKNTENILFLMRATNVKNMKDSSPRCQNNSLNYFNAIHYLIMYDNSIQHYL